MAQKKPEPNIRKVNPNAWMLTFSDLLTLMLCFFVLIYAMSSMDDKKFEGAFGVLTSAFGATGKTEHAELKPDPFQGVMAPVPEFLVRDIKDMLQRHVRDLPEEIIKPPEIEPIPDQFRAMFEVERVNEGVEVLIAGKILFDESGYKLLPASIALLQEIGGEAAEWAVPVRVEAYVNPTGKNRDQAWDLGVYRAAAVTNVLSGVNGLDPTLLSMMGYGRKAPKRLQKNGETSIVRVLFFTNKRDAASEKADSIEQKEVE